MITTKHNIDEIAFLVDGDMICFRACTACEREIEWEGDIWSLYVDLSEAINYVQDKMGMYITSALDKAPFEDIKKIKVIYCFSDRSGNLFRKKLLKTYKLNRVGKRKPIAYWALKKWVEDNCDTLERKYLEADDLLGILATGEYKGRSIVISGDKDLRSIPNTYVYNMISGELSEVSYTDAHNMHYYQTLVGDSADNYKGCPGVGSVKARRLLANGGNIWSTVVNAYKKAGLTEDDALLQARIAYILKANDYKGGKIKLWTPPKNELKDLYQFKEN